MILRSAPLLALGLAACSSTPPRSASSSASPAAPSESVAAVVPAASSAAPNAPPPAVAIDPVKAHESDLAAMRCLHDPTCPLADAERLFALATDQGSTQSCELLYRGGPFTKDWARARTCFERRMAAGPGCQGSSPSADRLTLATMYLDGQGGPKAPGRAPSLFQGCYEDVSAAWLTDEIAKRPAGSPPVDFCSDVGGTTLTMNECGFADLELAKLARPVALKQLAPRGASALKGEDAVARVFEAYVAADVEAHVFPMQMGSMAPLVAIGSESSDREDYAKWIGDVAAGANLLDDAARAKAEKLEADTLADVVAKADDPAWRTLIKRSEAEYQRFAKAAIAFAGVVLGAPGKADTAARLAGHRVERLKALLPE